ncbi:M42 family peptidase [Legionella israelensis]|uniref:M42 family peptidase n=2 Tax=Legionella israelensis TaxID=454 RepID=A0AAX1EE28_9GAMM|nr:M42 family metallopeptidase [Legionella israelensis]QBR83280.1 M42 family peptidase [Legionella israelensis]
MKKIVTLTFAWMLSLPVFAITELPLLAKLTETAGASGFEKPVRQMLKEQWQPFMSKLAVDGMGNLIGSHKNNQDGPRVLIMAHMDEVAFMVESITPEGFLKVIPIGGIYNSVAYAQRWQVSTAKGLVKAYSGMDSPHIVEKKPSGSPELSALFLDIGAASREEVESKFAIRPGLPVTPESAFTSLGEHRFLAKALDDRLGLAVISDAMRLIKHQQPNQLHLAATVQEEIGLRGASTLFESIHPDIAINVEVGIADDYPLLQSERKGRISLGKGPTLFVYDRSMIPNQELLNWVLALAEKYHINVQLEVEPGYGEDAAKLQTSGSGVPALNIGIPVRYAHQHAGVFDERDYQQAVKLLGLIIEHLNQEVMDQIKAG